MARDAALDGVLRLLRPRLGNPQGEAAAGRDAHVARRARERLHDAMAEDITADRFQLARAFRATHGASPHAHLVQIRLLRARNLLAAEERPPPPQQRRPAASPTRDTWAVGPAALTGWRPAPTAPFAAPAFQTARPGSAGMPAP